MPTINRPEPSEYASHYRKYVDLVPGGDILDTLAHQLDETLLLVGTLTDQQALRRYAPDKWSVKEVVGHVIDTERIFAYRALRISRGDRTPLPGYDQDVYVRNAGFDARPLADLTTELSFVRRGTLALFRGLTPEMLGRTGIANNNEVSARAIVWIIAGHERHHMQIVKEKYL